MTLFDRKGDVMDEIQVNVPIASMSWDRDGDVLAVMCEGQSQVTLWDTNARSVELLDSSMGTKQVDCGEGGLLAENGPPSCSGPPSRPSSPLQTTKAIFSSTIIGRRGLLFFSLKVCRKVPVLGKAHKGITCGAISSGDLIALGSDDCAVTVSLPLFFLK